MALAATVAPNAARAADYQQPPPPQIYVQPPQVIEEFASAWYLRGDVGIGINSRYDLDYLPNPVNVGNGFVFEQHSIADTFFIGTTHPTRGADASHRGGVNGRRR